MRSLFQLRAEGCVVRKCAAGVVRQVAISLAQSKAICTSSVFTRLIAERLASVAILILISLATCHALLFCGIIPGVMGNFWKEMEKSDPTRQPPPTCFFWSGVVLMIVCAVVVICKVASLYH